MNTQNPCTLWFEEICVDDVALVGGKNASLGEMYRTLITQGIGIIAAAFYPNPVVVRMSDFNTNDLHLGLCGQAPSDYPEMAEYLIDIGIDSISLNPDTIIKTTLHILDIEKSLGRKPRTGKNDE